MICAPALFFPHSEPQPDYSTTSRGETSPTGGLEYPPRPSVEALEDYELVKSSRPASAPPIPIDCFDSNGFDQPEPSPSPEPRPSPVPSTAIRASAPPEPIPQTIKLRVQFSPEVEEIPITTRAQLDRTPTPPPCIPYTIPANNDPENTWTTRDWTAPEDPWDTSWTLRPNTPEQPDPPQKQRRCRNNRT
ncbi:hypothetical protein Moror_13706 [Moniliophthora roreri MCA 2997]|nr:hypothetical protein Moror_13706 [Moniliophthora roreri MCA 2997]